MLIEVDQLIEELGILTLESVSDCSILTLDLSSVGRCERDGTGLHSVRDALSAGEDSFFC
jgi:hypothetical protein